MTGIIIIDKPEGWTSMDVCARLRRLLNERRIGHGGTLDPMATGVLPVFVGRATRAVEFAENAKKRYIAGIRPGIVTDTQDVTGTVLERRDANVTVGRMREAAEYFIGEQLQTPPMYSAVKVGGRKLYELARKGQNVERAPRRIMIDSIAVAPGENGDFILDVTCSKGTYIRTLCADIGEKLGCGAAMSSLRRTAAGEFTLDDAVALGDVEAAARTGRAEELLRPVDSLFAGCPADSVSGKNEKACLNGGEYDAPGRAEGLYRVYGEKGDFIMLGRCEGGVMRTVKSFFEV